MTHFRSTMHPDLLAPELLSPAPIVAPIVAAAAALGLVSTGESEEAPILAAVAAIPAVLGLALAPVAVATGAPVVVAATVVAAAAVAQIAAVIVTPPAPPLPPSETDPLHRSEQTISSLLDPAYWEAVCPWLQCRMDSSMLPKKPREQGEKGGTEEGAHRQGPPESEQERDKAAELLNRGFFQIKAAALPQVREGLVEALGRGVLRLQELGHSASAISSYDVAWELQHSLGPLVSRITGNPLSGDCYSFYVSPVMPSGFVGAHRDKPTADGSNSFRWHADVCHCVGGPHSRHPAVQLLAIRCQG